MGFKKPDAFANGNKVVDPQRQCPGDVLSQKVLLQRTVTPHRGWKTPARPALRSRGGWEDWLIHGVTLRLSSLCQNACQGGDLVQQ